MSITFSTHYTQRSSNWTVFKGSLAGKGLIPFIQFDDDGVTYTIWAYDGPEVYLCTIWKGEVPSGVLESGYTQEQNDADKAEFLGGFAAQANRTLDPKLSDGRSRIAHEKSTLSRTTLYSHDWSDPTTWYTTSAYIADETATDSGDHTTYTLAHTNVIDTYHGKVTNEDFILDPQGRSYRITVKVDGVVKTEQDPHPASGGDFTVNYGTGIITFLSAQSPTAVVTCTYHHMVSSVFVVAPIPGKNLRLDFAEVQFTTDIVITDSAVFQPYGFVDVFAPQLVGNGQGQIPSGTKIPLGPPLIYKGISDYQNDAVRSYPAYPALGGSGWRGMNVPTIVFDWDYQSASILYSAAGMEIRIFLQHDIPFGGTYATATFYSIVEDQ